MTHSRKYVKNEDFNTILILADISLSIQSSAFNFLDNQEYPRFILLHI